MHSWWTGNNYRGVIETSEFFLIRDSTIWVQTDALSYCLRRLVAIWALKFSISSCQNSGKQGDPNFRFQLFIFRFFCPFRPLKCKQGMCIYCTWTVHGFVGLNKKKQEIWGSKHVNFCDCLFVFNSFYSFASYDYWTWMLFATSFWCDSLISSGGMIKENQISKLSASSNWVCNSQIFLISQWFLFLIQNREQLNNLTALREQESFSLTKTSLFNFTFFKK